MSGPSITTRQLLEMISAIEAWVPKDDDDAFATVNEVRAAIGDARPITGGLITAEWVPRP